MTSPVDPITRTLTNVPALLEHLLAQLPRIRIATDQPGGTAWEAPTPINLDAYDDAHELWEALCATARVRKRLHAGTRPAEMRAQAARLCAAIDADRGRLIDEWSAILDVYARIAPRWPLRDRPRVSKTALCPDDRGTIGIRPPRWHGDEQLITCATCGRTFTEDEHEAVSARFAAVEAAVAAQSASDAVRRRLARKYGTAA